VPPRENSDGKVTRPQIDDSEEVRLRHRPLDPTAPFAKCRTRSRQRPRAAPPPLMAAAAAASVTGAGKTTAAAMSSLPAAPAELIDLAAIGWDEQSIPSCLYNMTIIDLIASSGMMAVSYK
jgi:hypothetical protein